MASKCTLKQENRENKPEARESRPGLGTNKLAISNRIMKINRHGY